MIQIKINILFLVLFAVCCGCARSNENEASNTKEASLTIKEDTADGFWFSEGIYVEQFDSTNQDENRFNKDNRIYQIGDTFTYSYKYTDARGQAFYSDQKSSWEFVSFDGEEANEKNKIIITVAPGLLYPEYDQTTISYSYPGNSYFSSSGVIENKKNIWMHPPRDGLFKILELNPFPFIQAPLQVGHQWEWQLKIGGHWGDKRWKVWDETITNVYTYQIVDIRNVKCALGNIECFVIESTAKSQLGETSLNSYFNVDHGFIKLDYSNINGSKLILELISHTKDYDLEGKAFGKHNK